MLDTQLPLESLKRLGVVAGVLALASLLPYASDRLVDYRYWDRLDASPLLRAVQFQPPPRLDDAVAQGLPGADDTELAGAELDRLAGVTSGPGATQTAEMAAEATGLAAALTQDMAAPQVAESGAPLDVEQEALGDQKVWLEGDLQALDPFWQALADLAAGKRTHVRIAHYGDSHIADDGITHVTRQLLQRRFGDGGHGFTLVQGRTQWYAHRGIGRSASEGWRLVNFLNGNAKDGAYGYGGVAVDGGAGEWFGLDSGKHPVSRFVLHYRSLGKATIAVKVDGKPATELKITAPAGTDATETWQVADGPHAVQWRITNGRVRLFGGAIERDRGVIYDSLGEVGARGTRWLNADARHAETMMRQRPPDLLVLNYGGNERLDKVGEANYLDRMTKVLTRLRAGAPQGACLLIGPGDHGVRDKGRIVSDPEVVRINAWQRKLADSTGCGFWDARRFMGGDGAMGRWVKQGLGWSDYSHLTGKGAQALGLGTYRALLKGLRDWQARPRTASR